MSAKAIGKIIASVGGASIVAIGAGAAEMGTAAIIIASGGAALLVLGGAALLYYAMNSEKSKEGDIEKS